MAATPQQLAQLPVALRSHRQFDGDFCAVSGYECIAKLSGHLAVDAFPLQIDAANQHKGFQPDHWAYLTGLGFTGRDRHFSTGPAASVVIQAETDAGRFPLAALPWPKGDGGWSFHVFLFAKHEGNVIWIDPAVPCVMLRGIDAIPDALENNRLGNPLDRRTVHVFTYT